MPKPALASDYLHGKIRGMVATAHKRKVGSRLRLMIEAVGQRPVDITKQFPGVTAPKLGNWMRGDDYPSEYFVTQLCERYNLSMDYLYRGRVVAAMDPVLA